MFLFRISVFFVFVFPKVSLKYTRTHAYTAIGPVVNTRICTGFGRYAMRLKSHTSPGAKQEDKQLAVLW